MLWQHFHWNACVATTSNLVTKLSSVRKKWFLWRRTRSERGHHHHIVNPHLFFFKQANYYVASSSSKQVDQWARTIGLRRNREEVKNYQSWRRQHIASWLNRDFFITQKSWKQLKLSYFRRIFYDFKIFGVFKYFSNSKLIFVGIFFCLN